MNSIAITSHGPVGQREMYRWLRRNFSLLAAIAVIVALGGNHDVIASKFDQGVWKIDSYYSAVFNWAAFQGAFLFSVYAFFLSRSEPFIKAISDTGAFRDLRHYVLRSLWLSMLLTLISLPAVVAVPEIQAGGSIFDPGFVVFWAMSALLAYTFGNTIKVVRVFRLLEGMERK